MVVAMVAVGMMQVAVHEVIHVVTVRNRFMATRGAVHMAGRVPIAAVLRSATVRIYIGYGQNMLLNRSIRALMMEMPIVKEVLMIAMSN